MSSSPNGVLKDESRKVLLEVHAPGLGKGDSVRVSGNTAELGEWSVHRSKPLSKRDGGSEMWYAEISLAGRGVEYRYLVVETLRTGENTGLRVKRRETFIEPRRLSLSQCSPTEATDGSSGPAVLTKDDGTFGYSDEGENMEDGGWLVETSELQLQLQDSEKVNPIRIDTLPNDTGFSVLVTSLQYCSKEEDTCKVAECLPVELKVMDRVTGRCKFKGQGEYGHIFHPNQVLVYWTQALDFTYLAFIVDVYSAGEDQPRHVGRASILPQHLRELAGRLVLTLLSPHMLPVGTITLSYLIINPAKGCPRAIHRTRQSFAHYWKKHKRTLDIGHRGLGPSHTTPDMLKPSATENTIASLKRAGAHGADYVEFDVQLTRDLIPVVYHDFTVCTTLARKGFSSGELYLVYVKDLTLHQLHHLKLDHSSAFSHTPSRDNTPYASDNEGSYASSDEAGTLLQWTNRLTLAVAGKEVSIEDDGPERKTFPTLEQVFRSLPSHIGFNIEVKYPVPVRDSDDKSFPYFERNRMADIILNVVYRLARRRKIIFSCFDPDLCTILRRKQPKYPVVFLSTADSADYATPIDVRARSFHDCMMHALAEKLLGVNVCSDCVLRQPKLVAEATASELVVFTWGRLNNKYANLVAQKRMGVHAVIYDRITALIAPQKNVFADEVDGEEDGEEEQEGECVQITAPS